MTSQTNWAVYNWNVNKQAGKSSSDGICWRGENVCWVLQHWSSLTLCLQPDGSLHNYNIKHPISAEEKVAKTLYVEEQCSPPRQQSALWWAVTAMWVEFSVSSLLGYNSRWLKGQRRRQDHRCTGSQGPQVCVCLVKPALDSSVTQVEPQLASCSSLSFIKRRLRVLSEWSWTNSNGMVTIIIIVIMHCIC